MSSNYALPTQGSTGNAWLDYYNQLSSSDNGGNQTWLNFLNSMPGGWEQIYYGLESDPQSAYKSYAGLMGQGQGQAYNDWLGSQYNKYYNQYQTMSNSNPSYMFTQYLNDLHPQQDYSMTDPYQRNGYFGQEGVYSPTQALRY